MNPELIHPDDEDREYELNRELDAAERRAIDARAPIVGGRVFPADVEDPDGTEEPGYWIGAPAPTPEPLAKRPLYIPQDLPPFEPNAIAPELGARLTTERTFPEPPAPHDDEHGLIPGTEDESFDLHAAIAEHGPLSASLSERTLDKVLSRPAHVPSIVMLDRDAAAHRLAGAAADVLAMPATRPGDRPALAELRQALADYRETCQ